MITGYTKCECGAITLYTDDNRSYCCSGTPGRRKRLLPAINLRKLKRMGPKTCCCDHCSNHWGIDLCACGSGEPYWKCNWGYRECGRPMQVLEGYTHVCGGGAWGE